MKVRVATFLLILSSFIYPQTYNGGASIIFFGRQASAKTEAMGKILSLNFDPYFTSEANPAALLSVDGFSIFYSYSTPPYYLVDNINFYFGGVSINLKELGAFAFNIQYVDWGKYMTTGSTSSEPTGWFSPTAKLYTFTYANRLSNYFDYGMNFNLLIEDFTPNVQGKGMFFELGIIKDFKIISATKVNDNILFGMQVKNVFNQSLKYKGQLENGEIIEEYEVLPSIFRIGVSNEFKYYDKKIYKYSHLFMLTTGIEYQDLFNSKYSTAYKFGAELSLFDILYLRTGYYYRTYNDYGINDNKGYKEDFTFGFGLNLNLEYNLIPNFPMSIKIDYVNLKQPTAVTYFDDWDNFTTFNIIINYRF